MHFVDIMSVCFFTIGIIYILYDVTLHLSWYRTLKQYNWDLNRFRELNSYVYLGLFLPAYCSYRIYKKVKMEHQIYVDQFKLVKSIEAIKKEYKIE